MPALISSMMYIAPVAFFPGSPGPVEVLVVCVLILLLFGARRLPEVARTLGAVFTDLRRSVQDFRDQIENEIPPPDDAIPRTPPARNVIGGSDDDAAGGGADGDAAAAADGETDDAGRG